MSTAAARRGSDVQMYRFLLTLAAVVLVAPPLAHADEVTAQIDALYARAIPADAPGGAVLVLRHGQVIARRAFGLASVELHVPMRPEQRFRIASISKQLTAVAILQLAEAGKLDLQAPISRYLHDAPAAWAKITVTALLNHTSGLVSPTDVAPELKLAITSAPTRAELRARLDPLPLHSPPGTAYAYNNWGYALLGQIIEHLTGQTYCDYLRTKLLGPLGMTQTRCRAGRTPIANLATGYDRTDDRALATAVEAPSQDPLTPAGGLISNVDDLARWTLALHGGRLVSPRSFALLTTATRLASGEEVPYGFGTRLRTVDGRALVVSNGDGPGFHSEIAVDRAADCVAIALYNFGPRYAYFSRRLLAIARGQPITLAPAVAVPPAALARFAGRYAGGDRTPRTIELDHGVLYSRGEGDRGRDALVAVAPQTFRLDDDDDTRLELIVERETVTGVRISTDGVVGEVIQRATH
jgi:D-alanyl-D-alanine carboxypeptidase